MKNRIDSSRRKTPWDKNEKISSTQKFIMEKYRANFNVKHPTLNSTNEKEIINSITIDKCKYCNSLNIKRNGFTKNGIQRYKCKDCNRQFSPITNTIFDNHKISITEWVEFLLDIFNYSSITLASKVNKNSINTVIYWLHKIFFILRDYQDNVVLKGDVYVDELFYKVIKSDIEKKEDGKQYRGLSRNQYCIGVGRDKSNIIAIVEGQGKTSNVKTKEAFLKHIEFNSKLIHDDEKSHRGLIKALELSDESYSSTYLKTLDDKENPLRPINHQCDLIRQFLNAHSGFDRKYLQDYLNVYCFMNSGHKNKLEKVDELLTLALTTKVSIKYREIFGKSKKD